MLTFLLYALLAWFLYKLTFSFIIPVYRATRQMKKAFKDMHSRMQEAQPQQAGYNPPPGAQKPTQTPANEDYIDFEEVK